MNCITVKPHHLLDILKLHGKGLAIFVPDPIYGHNFYKLANMVVNHEVDSIIFTIHGDDICKPCKYNINNQCTDRVSKTSIESKESHNKSIDTILLELLNLETDRVYKFIDILSLLDKKLSYEIFEKAWAHANKEELDFRFDYTVKGLKNLNT